MNGSAEIDKNELLNTLERLLPAQFKKLLLLANAPQNLMPSQDNPQTERAVDVILWAEAPGGCGLKQIKQTLEGMGITVGKLHCPSKDPNHIYKIAEAKLSNFDHKETLKTFKEVVARLEARESAGIFILQECLSQGGRYCSQKLIDHLTASTAEGNFHPFYIHPYKGEISQKGLLSHFARVLKNNQNLEELTEKDIINIIIKKIHDLVPAKDSGHTYLFHITDYDTLLRDKFFWNWFVENFWDRFIQDLPKITQKHPYLKLIFLFKSELNIEVEPNYIYCSSQDFTPTKIVNLPLKPCDMDEITAWLRKYSRLPQPIIEQLLLILHKKDRKPDQVYDLFREKLIEYLPYV